MRAPKGFGKNYFSLAAIQATVSHVLLQSQCARIDASAYTLHYDDDALCDEEDDQTLLTLNTFSKDAECSRTCGYRSQTILTLFNHHKDFTPRYHRFCSVSSPPSSYLFALLTQ